MAMADRKTTETHGLALVPLRNGKLLTNDNASLAQAGRSAKRGTSSRALIPLWHRNRNDHEDSNYPIIIGRPELLPCLYAACGCHSKIYSTKHKCGPCQEVSEWAVRALSRQMVCVRSENLVAVRGAHAIVVCDSQVVCQEEDAAQYTNKLYDNKNGSSGLCWRGRQRIQAGSKLEFREAEGDGLVEFQVVLVNRRTRKIVIQRKKSLLACNANSQAPSRTKDLAHNNNHNNKTCRNTTIPSLLKHQPHQAQFRIYFVLLGQDLSRQRIALLAQLAEKRGAQVMDDFRLATHLVISEQVTTLQQVANKLGSITLEDLKCHLDQVSV
jgi:hypothetical protein